MASVLLPPQRKTNLDVLQQGLQIAQALYGIRADMARVDAYKSQQAEAQAKIEAERPLREAQLDLTKAQAEKMRRVDEGPSGQNREVKFSLNGKNYIKSLRPNEAIPEGAQPYEEPKVNTAAGVDERRLDDIKSDAINKFDAQAKPYKDGYFKGKNVEALLNQGTPTAVSAAATQFMKLSGEVGAITDADIKRFGGSQDLMSRAKRLVSQQAIGELLPEDIRAMKDAARLLTEKNRNAFLAEADNIAARTAKAYRGVSEDDMKFILGAPDVLSRLDKEIYQSEVAQNSQQQTPLPGPFLSPQGKPFQNQQNRQQAVKKSWWQSNEAQAAPTPQSQPGFDPDAFLRGR